MGILNAQILEDGAGFYISDVNPRIGTSASLSYPFGFNPAFELCRSIKPGLVRPKPDGHNVTRVFRTLVERPVFEPWYGPITGIIFDSEFLLFDYKKWLFDMFCLIFEKLHHALPPASVFLDCAARSIEADPDGDLISRIGKQLQLSASTTRELGRLYNQTLPQDLDIYPDVLPALTEIGRRGLKLILLTERDALIPEGRPGANNFYNLFDTVTPRKQPGAGNTDGITSRMPSILAGSAGNILYVCDNPYSAVDRIRSADMPGAYVLQREGSRKNWNMKLFRELHGEFPKLREISDIRELLPDIGISKNHLAYIGSVSRGTA